MHDGAMTDDFFSLKILIVSEAASEREILRQVAAQASIPAEIAEIDAAGDPIAMRELFALGKYDFVFFDLPVFSQARQDLLNAVRTSPTRPLAVLVGAQAMRSREVLTDGLEVDGALAKPMMCRRDAT